jgi:hypothetical protein
VGEGVGEPNQTTGKKLWHSAVLRIRDVYPRSRISNPGSKTSNKREGRKKFVALPFFVATKITKFKIKLILNW